MKYEIKSRWDNTVIFSVKTESLKLAVEAAVKKKMNLRWSDLSWSDLSGSDLSGSDLSWSNLRWSDLRWSNLRGSDLEVKEPPLNSHQFISEILWRAAKTEIQKDFAARVRMQTPDGCWEFFAELARKKKVVKWAKQILCKWEVYKNRIKELEKQ